MLAITASAVAQNYSAIHGSSHFGSLGVYDNPSVIVSSPYKWDLTLLGSQYQTISNAIKGRNFPFNLLPSSTYTVAKGNYARQADLNYNLKLFNARYSIDKDNAFAFGLNMRGYAQAETSRINYNDSIQGPRTFLFYNEQNGSIDLSLASSAWLELYGSYGRNIWNTETSKLNAGVTLKLSRGMSGIFTKVNNVGIASEVQGDQTIYKITNGNARYGYSDNLGNGDDFSAQDLFSGSKMGVGIDLGVEYIIKTQAVTSIYDEGAEHDYDWKIGFSLLDLGWNTYTYSRQSRSVASLRDDVSSNTLNEKFASITNLQMFNDSLSTIVNSYQPLSGNFNIINPARAVINVDRYIRGNVYLNAELSVNLVSNAKSRIAVQESRLFSITPRWETRKLGIYLPIQYNRHGNLWIGGALKAGPILLGTHNLLNALSKNKYLASGAYIAITIRPFEFMKDPRNRQYDCPEY